MTQKAQDIDDLKGLNVQDIDDPVDYFFHLIRFIKQLIKGGIRWNRNSEKQPLNAI